MDHQKSSRSTLPKRVGFTRNYSGGRRRTLSCSSPILAISTHVEQHARQNHLELLNHFEPATLTFRSWHIGSLLGSVFCALCSVVFLGIGSLTRRLRPQCPPGKQKHRRQTQNAANHKACSQAKRLRENPDQKRADHVAELLE